MAMTSLGDLAQSFQMRHQNGKLKIEMSTLLAEIATGQSADLAKTVSGDLNPIAGIQQDLTRLEGFGTATVEASLFTDTMQDALEVFQSQSQSLSASLITAGVAGNSSSVSAIGSDAKQKFETMVSAVNAQIGGRSLFGGAATNRPPLADPNVILDALATASIGASNVDDVVAAVDAWFAPGGGFDTIGYTGSSTPLAAFRVAANRNVQLDATAEHAGIVDTLKAVALGALIEKNVFAGNGTQQLALAQRAGEAVMTAQSTLSALRADVGTVQATIDQARQSNETQSFALEIARAGIVQIDPYETATKLESVQIQLESLYAITARMSRLSLVDYLR
ncbi:MAG: flagellar hook-associated protein 3 FlgL [Paracoccaceae bacterium]|jgi:flagellar hook-associated protein 3 FlgL|tara:strand:- start:386 stop:1393 length:1008 start_codon:yes stop_codon:yes gene_type:complete